MIKHSSQIKIFASIFFVPKFFIIYFFCVLQHTEHQTVYSKNAPRSGFSTPIPPKRPPRKIIPHRPKIGPPISPDLPPLFYGDSPKIHKTINDDTRENVKIEFVKPKVIHFGSDFAKPDPMGNPVPVDVKSINGYRLKIHPSIGTPTPHPVNHWTSASQVFFRPTPTPAIPTQIQTTAKPALTFQTRDKLLPEIKEIKLPVYASPSPNITIKYY